MLKPLTMSLSLVLALGLTGMSKADLFHHTGLASPQGVVPTAQAMPSPQGVECAPACTPGCGGLGLLKKCGGALNGLSCKLKDGGHNLCQMLKPKPHCYTYEWVLKKKKVKGGCGAPSCDTCGGVAPSPQGVVAPSGQGPWVSPQAGYSAPTFGSGQVAVAPTGMIAPAPVAGDEAPPAPEVGPTGPTSSLLFSTPAGH